jgi:hypothetical protein
VTVVEFAILLAYAQMEQSRGGSAEEQLAFDVLCKWKRMVEEDPMEEWSKHICPRCRSDLRRRNHRADCRYGRSV